MIVMIIKMMILYPKPSVGTLVMVVIKPAAVELNPVTRVRTTMPRANIRFKFRNGIRFDITW